MASPFSRRAAASRRSWIVVSAHHSRRGRVKFEPRPMSCIGNATAIKIAARALWLAREWQHSQAQEDEGIVPDIA
jgi:hypothetical protein